VSGDGCSDSCKVETGYECQSETSISKCTKITLQAPENEGVETATSTAVIMTTSAMILTNIISLRAGPDLWVSVNFIQVARTSVLISQKNKQITSLLLGGLNIFSFNFGLGEAAPNILSFTDYGAREASEVYQDYGFSTVTFIYYLGEKFISAAPLTFAFLILWGFCKFLSRKFQNKIMLGVNSFISNFLFFNLPLRVILEMILDLNISAFGQFRYTYH
jgi:hypothetical protein